MKKVQSDEVRQYWSIRLDALLDAEREECARIAFESQHPDAEMADVTRQAADIIGPELHTQSLVYLVEKAGYEMAARAIAAAIRSRITAVSPTARRPFSGGDVLAKLKVTQCCDVVIDGLLGVAIEEIERLRAALARAESDLYILAEWSTAPGATVSPDRTVCGARVPLLRFAREARFAAYSALERTSRKATRQVPTETPELAEDPKVKPEKSVMTDEERKNRNPAPELLSIKLADHPVVRRDALERNRAYILLSPAFAMSLNYIGRALSAYHFHGPRPPGVDLYLWPLPDGSLRDSNGFTVEIREYRGPDA